MKGWYQAAVDRALPLAQVTLKWIMAEWVDLYRYIPPTGENIPVSVQPFLVEDLVPEEDEIEWSVERIHNHSYGGPSWMWSEHIKGWMLLATKEEVAAAQTAAVEGMTAVLRGIGGEETE